MKWRYNYWFSEPLYSKILEKEFHCALHIFSYRLRDEVAKGWGWDFGQNLSNCQAIDQAENLEI